MLVMNRRRGRSPGDVTTHLEAPPPSTTEHSSEPLGDGASGAVPITTGCWLPAATHRRGLGKADAALG